MKVEMTLCILDTTKATCEHRQAVRSSFKKGSYVSFCANGLSNCGLCIYQKSAILSDEEKVK